MARWIEDPSLEAPDGHVWQKPAPDDCPNCPCHTARVCEGGLWLQASRPTNPDGTPYTRPCPCESVRRIAKHGDHRGPGHVHSYLKGEESES